MACSDGVVTAQCGAEIAGLVHELDERMLEDLECSKKYKRQYGSMVPCLSVAYYVR